MSTFHRDGICSVFIINYLKLVLTLTWSTSSVPSGELFCRLDSEVPGQCVRALVTENGLGKNSLPLGLRHTCAFSGMAAQPRLCPGP